MPGAYRLWLPTLLAGVIMDYDDIAAYVNYVMCRTEFENDNIIWGEDVTDLNEADKRPKMTIFEKYKDEKLGNIPY